MHRTTVLASITGLVASSLLVIGPVAPASGVTAGTCDSRTNDTLKKLLDCVTLDGVREHQAALQGIADANGGTRAAGTPGYQASVDYAAGVLTNAGYNVSVQPFAYAAYEQLAPSTLQQTRTQQRLLCRGRRLPHHELLCVWRCHGAGDRCRHPARPWEHVHQRLRCRRLRRVPGGQHRAHPARCLLIRAQGRERRGRRSIGRDHLQPGQRPRTPPARTCSAVTLGLDYTGGIPVVSMLASPWG